MAKFLIRDGENKRKVRISAPVFFIGRSSDCQIQIEDGQASRKHLEITEDNGKISIEDLDTSNGTFLNGEKLAPGLPTEISPDDKIKIGKCVICLAETAAESVRVKAISDEEASASVSGVEKIPQMAEKSESQYYLRVQKSDAFPEGHEIGIKEGQVFTLGRSKDSHVVLLDNQVSGQHAEIILKDDKIFIEDLNSRNGVRVNSQKVSRAELKANDRVKIGGNKFIFCDAMAPEGVNLGDTMDFTEDQGLFHEKLGDLQDAPSRSALPVLFFLLLIFAGGVYGLDHYGIIQIPILHKQEAFIVPAGSLIENGGFDQNTDNWTLRGSADLSKEKELFLPKDSVVEYALALDVKALKQYALSFKAKSERMGEGVVRVNWLTASGDLLAKTENVFEIKQEEPIALLLGVPPHASKAVLSFKAERDDIWIDDVAFVPATSKILPHGTGELQFWIDGNSTLLIMKADKVILKNGQLKLANGTPVLWDLGKYNGSSKLNVSRGLISFDNTRADFSLKISAEASGKIEVILEAEDCPDALIFSFDIPEEEAFKSVAIKTPSMNDYKEMAQKTLDKSDLSVLKLECALAGELAFAFPRNKASRALIETQEKKTSVSFYLNTLESKQTLEFNILAKAPEQGLVEKTPQENWREVVFFFERKEYRTAYNKALKLGTDLSQPGSYRERYVALRKKLDSRRLEAEANVQLVLAEAQKRRTIYHCEKVIKLIEKRFNLLEIADAKKFLDYKADMLLVIKDLQKRELNRDADVFFKEAKTFDPEQRSLFLFYLEELAIRYPKSVSGEHAKKLLKGNVTNALAPWEK